MMKKALSIILLLALLVVFFACSPAERTAYGFSMGSDYKVSYDFNGDLDKEIADLFASVESSYSVRVDSSVLSRLNAAKAGEMITLTTEENEVLYQAFALASATRSAFDPAILPLVKLWGFDPPYEMNGEVPPADIAILKATILSGMNQFTLYHDLSIITKRSDDAALDLGAAIKGYAVGRALDLLREKGATKGLVYLGGTVGALGDSYPIGVTAPRESDQDYAFRFTLSDGEICATSGDYERFYEYEGKRYHHILDVNTGYPASSDVISATIVAKDGLIADAFATAVVVLGVEKGVALLEEYGIKGAIVTDRKKVVTVGLTVTIKDTTYEIV